MGETIDLYLAIALIFEAFFFGGCVFAADKRIERILSALMGLTAIFVALLA
jgi:hypothetical protein